MLMLRFAERERSSDLRRGNENTLKAFKCQVRQVKHTTLCLPTSFSSFHFVPALFTTANNKLDKYWILRHFSAWHVTWIKKYELDNIPRTDESRTKATLIRFLRKKVLIDETKLLTNSPEAVLHWTSLSLLDTANSLGTESIWVDMTNIGNIGSLDINWLNTWNFLNLSSDSNQINLD